MSNSSLLPSPRPALTQNGTTIHAALQRVLNLARGDLVPGLSFPALIEEHHGGDG